MNKHNSRREFLRRTAINSAAIIPMAMLPPAAWASSVCGLGPDEKAFLNAARDGDLARIKKLLGEDSRLLQSKNGEGVSAYAIALLSGHTELAEYLKQNGYQSDIHESALANDWERFDELSKGDKNRVVEKVNSDHPIGGTAMFTAAAGGSGSDMWRVYALCGNPNLVPNGQRGVSPLQKALRFRDLPTAEMTAAAILSNDANPNPKSNGDLPPLHIAASRGSIEMAEMLIRLGADVAATDEKGKTALQNAREKGHAEVTKLLTGHESIPRTCQSSRTAYDVDGKPYRARDISDIPLVDRREFVGKSHFNLDYVTAEVTKEPRLAHSVAMTSEICVEACGHIGRKPIVEFLLKHGSPYSLPTAVMMNDLATVKKYLDEDPKRIQERGAHDFPLLWYPIIGRCPIEMMEFLLEKGADVEQQHFMGTTALHWAASRNDDKAVELLISKGANVNRKGRKFSAGGETPLKRAREESMKKLLIAHGAQ